jgi:hypothetical protein
MLTRHSATDSSCAVICKHHPDTVPDPFESRPAAARGGEQVVQLKDAGVPVERAEQDSAELVAEDHGARDVVVAHVNVRAARGDPWQDVGVVGEARE